MRSCGTALNVGILRGLRISEQTKRMSTGRMLERFFIVGAST